jgi:phosphoribosylaminoimidazolecarboxamide formyltransferase/IMP cyclohydrolase
MSRTALISAYDKTGLTDFARGLSDLGWVIYASGGTAAEIRDAGMEVTPTESITGIGSILGGRVKTLHPELHASILAAGRDREERLAEGKPVFDLVAVDFYPFHRTADLPGDDPALVELIDIGGPSMVRGAAKNYAHVTVAAGADSFGTVLDAVRNGEDTLSFRRAMAARAFDVTSRYDLEVSLRLEEGFVPDLRYGENPHQSARVHFRWPREGFGAAEVLGGKPLSYNNYLDATAAWDVLSDISRGRPALVLMKHGNPCGVGVGASGVEAFENAFRADTASPYGGILAFSDEVDAELVSRFKGVFLEIVMAPGFSAEALEKLGKRKNLRVLRMPGGRDTGMQLRSVWGGLLIQQPDVDADQVRSGRVVTARIPTEAELDALDLAWRICKGVKSNAIVVGDSKGTLGVGAGQMSRIESLDLALRRALREGNDLRGAVLASDGFFPFRDGPDRAAEEGIAAIVQPGGSIRDEEVVAAADEHGMAMVMTGTRHFRH